MFGLLLTYKHFISTYGAHSNTKSWDYMCIISQNHEVMISLVHKSV